MTSIDVDLPPPTPDPPHLLGARRRRTTAIVAVGLPVVAAVLVLGVRAWADDGVDPSALPDVDAMMAVVEPLRGPDGVAFSGGSAGPDAPMSGTATSPGGPWTADVTVACTSVDGAPAELVVRSAGVEVGSMPVPCAHGGDATATPALSTLEGVELGDSWSVHVTAGSPAALAVVAS